MNKRLFLTSVLAITVAGPAFVVEAKANRQAQTYNQFSEPMVENATYTGAAVYANLHVDGSTEDPAVADPSFTICPADSYCPGVDSNSQPDSTAIFVCDTVSSGDYPNSDEGSSDFGQCYRDCVTSDVTDAATLVSGGRIYATGERTCAAATCRQGYHTVAGVYNLRTVIGSDNADQYATSSSPNSANYNLGPGQFVVDFGANKGRLVGFASCSAYQGSGGISESGPNNYSWSSSPTMVNSNGGNVPSNFWSTGDYCYCGLSSFTEYSGGTAGTEHQLDANGAVYVYVGVGSVTGASCSSNCATECGRLLSTVSGDQYGNDWAFSQFRQAMIDSIGSPYTTCAVNNISITWNGATQENIDANNAGYCVYEGDIRTPVAATPRAGYTFAGWTFQDNTQQQGGGNEQSGSEQP